MCVEHVRNVCGVCEECVWSMSGMCVEHVRIVCGACEKCVWSMRGMCAVHMCTAVNKIYLPQEPEPGIEHFSISPSSSISISPDP